MKTAIRILVIVFLCFLARDSKAQDTAKLITGKWAVCFSWDTYDSLCQNQYNAYHLKTGGEYNAMKPIICMDKEYFQNGHWTVLNRTLTINI